MLYVLARSYKDFRDWMHCTGLPPSVVRPILDVRATQGIQLNYSDVVRLDGFYLNPHAGEITDMLSARGIRPSKVAPVAQRPL